MSISESAALECEEKARLLWLCTMAESHHQIVVQQITWLIGKPEKPNYEELAELADTARRIWDDAHGALERHTSEHGC